jgi:hypothetical protein
MHTRERTHAGHTARFTVTESPSGWEVREERDSRMVRRVEFSDWHRVERAMLAFEEAHASDGEAHSTNR